METGEMWCILRMRDGGNLASCEVGVLSVPDTYLSASGAETPGHLRKQKKQGLGTTLSHP